MITVSNLVKSFGANGAVNDVSLRVAAGEVAAIIGPSGSGKTTFLRCINGLETFQGGRVEIGDLLLTPETHPRRDAALLQSVRRRVGMVFQQFNLFPHLTALENLCEAPLQVLRESRGDVEARAARLLERVGMAEKKDAYPKDLSGGQQQRVAIARTLMMKPDVVLFDEPTSALDPVMAAEVLAVVSELARDGQTMIVVTHSMRFARHVASRVHVFAGGCSVECGPPGQVFEDPQHTVTQAFLKSCLNGKP